MSIFWSVLILTGFKRHHSVIPAQAGIFSQFDQCRQKISACAEMTNGVSLIEGGTF
jgi:hypothetical protein